MNDPTWLADARLRAHVEGWRTLGALDEAAWRRAQEMIGPWPRRRQWRSFLEHLSLWLAVALIGAAVICFIAANWDQLGRFARLAGVQLALALATLAAWRWGLERAAGQAALLLAALLLGGLLALVGQTYQTGADTWQLFALWAGLLVPWLIAAVAAAMSLLWIGVVNLALVLYVGEHSTSDVLLWLVPGVFNLFAWLAWTALARRSESLRARTGPRLVASAALGFLTAAALGDVLGQDLRVGAGLVAWLLATAAAAVVALRVRRDLAVLALAVLGVIVVATSLVGRLLLDHGEAGMGGVLLLAVMVVTQAAVASTWLRRLAAEGRTHDV